MGYLNIMFKHNPYFYKSAVTFQENYLKSHFRRHVIPLIPLISVIHAAF